MDRLTGSVLGNRSWAQEGRILEARIVDQAELRTVGRTTRAVGGCCARINSIRRELSAWPGAEQGRAGLWLQNVSWTEKEWKTMDFLVCWNARCWEECAGGPVKFVLKGEGGIAGQSRRRVDWANGLKSAFEKFFGSDSGRLEMCMQRRIGGNW